MANMERTSAAPVPAVPFQFTIRSLLWFTLSVAMVLAFVRPVNERLLPIALGAALVGVVAGVLVGWPFGRACEGVYWSLLSMALATICIAGQPHLGTIGMVQMIGWPLVGAMAGAFAGALPSDWTRRKLAACVVAGVLPLAVLTSLRLTLEQAWDLAFAAIVSTLLAVLSGVFTWARARYRTSYGAWAAALVLAVILGNLGAEWFTPVLNDLLESR